MPISANASLARAAAPRKVRVRVPVKDQQALAQVLGLLGQTHIANNLNQIAYEANCGSLLMDEETENEIKDGLCSYCLDSGQTD